MTSPGTGILLLVATLLVCLIVSAYDRDMVRKRSIFRRQRPRHMRHRLDFLRRNQLTEMGTLDNTSDWVRSFIPEVPSEEDVDCSIEVEVVEVIGGRCVRLGGARRMAVCQSGMYLDVQSEECQYILAAREMNELRQQLEQINPSQTAMENDATDPENGLTETQQAIDRE